MKRILVLGANPAKQKTLFFKEFHYGEVNRAARMEVFAAGKGINFCRAARIWGRARGTLLQFVGGDNGRFVCERLDAEGMECRNISVAGETRCCVTCLDETRDTMTEVIEPSVAVTAAEAEHLLAEWARLLPEAAGAAICGSLPDGSDGAIYRRAAESAHAAQVPILFDAWKEVDVCLQSGDNLLKINREELVKLTGEPDLRDGLRRLFATCRVRFAAITDGADAAFASDGKTFFRYAPPRVAHVVNPIGCGDTASAVMFSEIVAGTAPEEAFRYALAAASANCLTSFPGSFDRDAAEKFAAEMRFTAEKL